MPKDIAVYIPTRNNPEFFGKTIDMLIETCSSIDNFDVFALIDDDQIELYSSVVSRYSNVFCMNPPHAGPNSPFMMRAFFDFIKSNDYYFIWAITDDFWGLSRNWDSEILKKKDAFDDATFMLHTTNLLGRNLNALTSQFRTAWDPFDGANKPIVRDPAYLIYHYHEMLPICTKKWWMAIRDFFDDDYKGADIVFLCASLAHILSVRFGYSRLLQVNVRYEDLIDNNNALNVFVDGLNRDQFFMKWAVDENFSMIEPVAKKVADNIFYHYSDLMCEARVIEKVRWNNE